MSSGFVFTVWSLAAVLLSAAVSAKPGVGGEAGRTNSWFLGCVSSCTALDPLTGDQDPVHCSARCQREGCSVAAVTSTGCFCGNQKLLRCPSSICPNISSTRAPGHRVALLPIGESRRNVALYQTYGPFLDNICLSVSTVLVFTKTTFDIKVSGNLAAPLDQPTGIFGLGRQELSDVTVEFVGMTPKGQSSLHVNILDHGFFNVSSNWRFEAPGTYEIRVVTSNILSVITVTQNLTVLAQTEDVLVKDLPRVDSEAVEDICSLKPTCITAQNKTVRVRLKEKRETGRNGYMVEVYAAKQAYPTNTDVHLSALTDAQNSVEFFWDFGDFTSARSMLKTITKQYNKPGRYNVTVVMVTPWMSTASEPFPIIIQRAVKLNRLVHQASVLRGQTVTLSCRVNSGTELHFLWTFGDGSSKHGQSSEKHVFQSLGEFPVEVTVFNLVSRASLRRPIFVVDTHCQPPPVKNMGPVTIKVPRHEGIRLGVTYESEFDCDTVVSEGVQYTWTLLDSLGEAFPLSRVETQRQTLMLPRHFLHYDTYTAIAKVKVVGSAVYSNYSVKLQVVETPPVAIVQGGTNVFINNRNSTVIMLDGTQSYDPDYPQSTARLHWTCKPLSIISTSCFNRDVHMSSARMSFSASFLEQNFDQFQITLTIESAGRSASSDVFLTVNRDLQWKVSVEIQNPKVNWDQPLSVRAFCDQCTLPSLDLIHYTWSLFLVNASSRPVNEVPFCYTLDLSAPSAIQDTTSTALSPRHQRSVLDLDSTMDLTRAEDTFDNPRKDINLFDREHQEMWDLFESSTDWDFPISEEGDEQKDLHYDHFLTAEEGESEKSPGRITVEGEEGMSHWLDPQFDAGDEGSDLVDLRPAAAVLQQTLLDLPRDPVPRQIFETYTHTGISSSQLIIKPFSLWPGSRYMLDVIATQTENSQKQILGRTQLFFQTKPAPKGMTCQVQPANGVELISVFSIFCTSGKQDLLYKYSFSIGDKPPQTLYQGADFEHYFSLPAGDPNRAYEVTISIEIRSSIHGGTTRPCPVTVTVQPHFVRNTSCSDPGLKLSQAVLRSLSSGFVNGVESVNYIGIVADIVNRLSLEPALNKQPLGFLRNSLVCVVCETTTIHQFSIQEAFHILGKLLKTPDQLTLATMRKVTGFIHFIGNQPFLDQKMLNNIISLLSHNLKTISNYNYQKDSTVLSTEIGAFYKTVGNNASSTINSCLSHSGSLNGLSLAKHLVDSILHVISDVSLNFFSLHKQEEIHAHTDVVSVVASSHRSTIRCGFSVLFLPQSLAQHYGTCVVSVVIVLKQNPYFWAQYPEELTGPVVEWSLFRCDTKRKIPLRFFAQPFEIQLPPQENPTNTPEYFLQHNAVNYHSFNISHQHLQHAIQLHVQFTPSATRVFPVILLFRMFKKPTPSEYDLHIIHNWKTSAIFLPLPSVYLKAGGVGHVALLNADFERAYRWRKTKAGYSLRVKSSRCVSWEPLTGTWSHHCKTISAQTSSSVNCSCHQLYPVTLAEEEISTLPDTGDLDGIVRVSYNWTVLCVLLLGVAFYVGALVWSLKSGVGSGQRRVHFLSDNLPHEMYHYAVTLHTGLCSAAQLSAKVYIVLCGEHGYSQTKELQVPGCLVFKRNSEDTFIVSSAESLGSLRGIHIWHDNSGPTPAWFLKHVEVFELRRDGPVGGHTWLFDGHCWLAVDRTDGRVERMLRVCSEEISFGKLLRLKVCDYMADFHLWISLYSCSKLHQRLSMCVLLWLGYAFASTVTISQMNLELDIEDLSWNAVTTGILSVVLILPAATILLFIFQLSHVIIMRPTVKGTEETKAEGFEDMSLNITNSSWDSYLEWPKEHWRKNDQDSDLSSVSSWCLNDTISKENVFGINDGNETQDLNLFRDLKKKENASKEDPEKPQWFNYAVWVVWLLLCSGSLGSSAAIGLRFSHRQAVLWIQSLLFSLVFCIFFIHPLLVFLLALVVSVCHGKNMNVSSSRHYIHKSICKTMGNSVQVQTGSPILQELLKARQRQRYLRLVRPPSLTELRKSRYNIKRERLICETVWEWFVFASLLSLMLCVACGSFSRDYYNLNSAVKKPFISGQDSFMGIRKYEDWWRWAQTSLIDSLFKNTTATNKHFTAFQNSNILVGKPVLWKTEEIYNKKNALLDKLTDFKVTTTETKMFLGHTKAMAGLTLKQLESKQWIGRRTVVLKVHFTLYSPAPNLFTSVTLTVKQSVLGLLLPSAHAQSVPVVATLSHWYYIVMACKLLFLILLLLRVCHHILSLGEKGLLRYSKIPGNWLEVGVFVVAVLFYVYSLYRTALVSEVAEKLRRQNSETHIDLSELATTDQTIRSLSATLLFLLTVKCVSLVNKTSLLTRSICSPRILISSLIILAVFSSLRNLQTSYLTVNKKLSSSKNIFYYDIFYLLTRLVCAAIVINIACSSVKSLCRERSVITTADLVQYIKKKLFSKKTRSANIDHNVERKNYYLEQFESVLDELLLKLDVLSDQTEMNLISRQHSEKIETQGFPEYEITQPFLAFDTKRSGPNELNYVPPKTRKRNNISEGIDLPSNIHQEEEMRHNREVEKSKKQVMATSFQDKSSKVFVEVLVEVHVLKDDELNFVN